jgi:hypothetical protein
MNTHYTKDDVVALAEQIFLTDVQSEDTRSIETGMLAGGAIFAAEVFYNKAAEYHRGELETTLARAHKSDELEKERRQTEDRRKGDRRTEAKGCVCSVCAEQTSSEEDEAFARMEKALRQHFQTTVIGISKG